MKVVFFISPHFNKHGFSAHSSSSPQHNSSTTLWWSEWFYCVHHHWRIRSFIYEKLWDFSTLVTTWCPWNSPIFCLMVLVSFVKIGFDKVDSHTGNDRREGLGRGLYTCIRECWCWNQLGVNVSKNWILVSPINKYTELFSLLAHSGDFFRWTMP